MPESEVKGIGERIKELRRSGESIAGFARRVGVPEANIRTYMRGMNPQVDKLVRIARACGVTVDWLATGHGIRSIAEISCLTTSHAQTIKRCLFLIDVQNGFINPATQPIIPHLEQLARDFKGEFILATKFVNRDGSGFTDIMGWHELKGGQETALLPFVEACADFVIEKSSYSACSDEVMKILREKAIITEVVLAGIDTDCCVLATAISLFEHNIRPVVLEKYCASTGGAASHAAGIRVLNRLIGAAQIANGMYP